MATTSACVAQQLCSRRHEGWPYWSYGV